MSIDVKYRTSATTTGGRDGGVRSEDGHLQAKLSTPKELGGPGGEGTNPEQLFAAGYSACFLSALKFAGHQMKVQLPQDVSVKATIGVGPRKEGGLGLAAAKLDIGSLLSGHCQRLQRHAADRAVSRPLRRIWGCIGQV